MCYASAVVSLITLCAVLVVQLNVYRVERERMQADWRLNMRLNELQRRNKRNEVHKD